MLPNLADLAAGIHLARQIIDDNPATDWTEDPGQHATFLILGGGALPNDVFRTALAYAAERHQWDEATVTRIIRTAIAVDELAELTGSKRLRPDPAEMAKTVAAQATPPRPAPVLPSSVYFTRNEAIGTVLDGVTVGRGHQDTPFRLLLDGVLIAACRGGGKTTLLNNIIAGIAQTNDATVWVGDVEQALLPPWMRSTLTRRLIGWPAVGAEATSRMLDAALELIRARKTHGASLMRRLETDRYPISTDDPAVIVLLDDSFRTMSALAAKVTAIRRLGPAMRVQVVTAVDAVDRIAAKDRKLSRVIVGGSLDGLGDYETLFGRSDTIPAGACVPDRPGRFVSSQAGTGRMDMFQVARVLPGDILGLGQDLSAAGHTPPLLPGQYRNINGYLQRWEDDGVRSMIVAVDRIH
jgi:hypothetical protein